MKKIRDFVFCTAITAVCYLAMSMLYYSQIYLMYDYFSADVIYATADGWANLAQAAGMFTMLLLTAYGATFHVGKWFHAGVYVAMLPVICLSLLRPGGAVLMVTILLLNFLVGLSSTFYFSQIAAYLPFKLQCFSFAIAYAVGSLGTWLVSEIDEDLMVSWKVLPIDVVLVGLAVVLILSYQNAYPVPVEKSKAHVGGFFKEYRLPVVLIALMSAVSMLGSGDTTTLMSDIGLSLAGSRGLYGLGLLLSAFLFTKDKNVGAVCTVASLVFPFLGITLLHEGFHPALLCFLSYVALGFFAVYRAGVFMDIASNGKWCPLFAVGGLMVSRVADAIITLVCGRFLDLYFPVGIILAGILFVPLIILFFTSFSPSVANSEPPMSEEERRAAFAKQYALTRREEEIAFYLAQNKTNGEIAAALHLSENTVRFHVANVLKKTGASDRNEVSRTFHIQMPK